MDNDNKANTSKSSMMMKLGGLLIAVAVAVLIIVGIVAIVNNHNHNKIKASSAAIAKINPAEVSITSGGFVPATISVSVNQPVIWTNNDTASHIIASDPYPKDNAVPGLNSQLSIAQGKTYTYVFTKAGTYTYHDNLNPFALKGTVIVK